MSAPRFLPLVCPRCSDDLAGRAVDRAAFCRACGRAYRVDGGALADLPARHVTLAPPGEGTVLALPFWVLGTVAVPAFLGARPLTMARIATRALATWRTADGVERPLPLGVRVAPDSAAQVCRLARLPAPPAGAPLTLLAVPARVTGSRYLLPADAGTLYPDDLHEARLLHP